MKKFGSLFAIFFLLFIVALTVTFVVCPKESYSSTEKRSLAELPAIRLETLTDGSFMKATDDYLADHFPFRDQWMRIKTAVQSFLGIRESENVYRASGDRLIQKFTAPPEEREQELINALQRFAEKNAESNFYLLVAPTAFTIESDTLPPFAENSLETDFIDRLYQSLPLYRKVDIRGVFEANKDRFSLYYRSDHHWTSKGAFLAAGEFLDSIECLTETTYHAGTVSSSFVGSLVAKSGFTVNQADTIEVYLPDTELPYTIRYSDRETLQTSVYETGALVGDDPYEVFFGGNHPSMTIETGAETERTLLVLKDSYANAFLPFLIPEYKTITVVDPRYYYDDIDALMGQRFTDVLVLYNAETLSEDTSLIPVLRNEQ